MGVLSDFVMKPPLRSITLPTSIECLCLCEVVFGFGSQLPKSQGGFGVFIENTQLQDLPDEIYEISSLEKLILHGNWVENRPTNFKPYTSKSLDLSLNRLTSLPESTSLPNVNIWIFQQIKSNTFQISRHYGKLTHLIAFDIQAQTIDIGALPKNRYNGSISHKHPFYW